MNSVYDYLERVLESDTPHEQRIVALRQFARELNWIPSFEFHSRDPGDDLLIHLIVEHGLENTAVLSFLRAPIRLADMSHDTLSDLLALSYNNLVQWNVVISDSEVRFLNNLLESPLIRQEFISREDTRCIDEAYFSKEIRSTPLRVNHRTCDSLLIEIISRWKRLIKAEYKNLATNAKISAILNLVIFVRACEDHNRRTNRVQHTLLLRDIVSQVVQQNVDLVHLIRHALAQYDFSEGIYDLVNESDLDIFTNFDRTMAHDLIADFYRPSRAPYPFDFDLMSKHALSKIYERYVSILQFEEDPHEQMTFIPPVPFESSSTKEGAIFTPQFVASFFGRYLQENMPPRAFRSAYVIDPACGSGIFLRTILELQSNPLSAGVSLESVQTSYQHVHGIDKDPNACAATRLSLSLLSLSIVGVLPSIANVRLGDSISLATQGALDFGLYDVVLMNPPYVKLEHMSLADRQRYRAYLVDDVQGRLDAYLAFVKLSFELAAPDGFIALVLPHVFLQSANARFLRKIISESMVVRCLVDLSAVPVFGSVGIYNILLILEKRSPRAFDAPDAQLVRCQTSVGPALQACLDGRLIETENYEVFHVGQEYFLEPDWVLLNSAELRVLRSFRGLKTLRQYLEVRQGYVSGDDSVFVIERGKGWSGERKLLPDFLPDKEIFRYKLPKSTGLMAFHPYIAGQLVVEQDLETKFSKIWAYLEENRDRLNSRRAVVKGQVPWWRPERPRRPDAIRRPKIVSPHLMLTPRFALDVDGQYIVSRTPFVIGKSGYDDLGTLKLFCAILNSSVMGWYISKFAYKYGHGYNRIEVSFLKTVPVPDPASISMAKVTRVIALVDRCLELGPDRDTEREIDKLVFDLYGLSKADRRVIIGDLGEEPS